MGVPNHRHIVQQLFAVGVHDLKTKDGAGLFTEAAAAALHAIDPNWGHLRKPEGRTHVVGPDGNRHAVDVVLYRSLGQIVDIIRDAGEPGAGLSWGVGHEGEYGEADWYSPTGDRVPNGSASESFVMPPYPGDQFGSQLGSVLFADYAAVGLSPNAGMGVWFTRTDYDYVANVVNGMAPPEALQASLAKHRNEWRAILGLPLLR